MDVCIIVTALAGVFTNIGLMVFYEYRLNKSRKFITLLQNQIRIYEEDRKESRLRQHEFKKELKILQTMAEGEMALVSQTLWKEEQDTLYFELQPILRDILRSYTEVFEKEEIEIRLTATGWIPYFEIEDKDFITIVANLMDNAVEAVRGINGKRWIAWELGEDEGEKWLCISNPCCEEEEFDSRIMERGVSGKGADRGLGLYLVGKLVKKYGGEIRVIRSGEFYVKIEFYK